MKIAFLNIKSNYKSIWDRIATQSYGVLILSQILRDYQHDIRIYDNKMIAGKPEILLDFDCVCFSFYTSGSTAAYKISDGLSNLAKKHDKKIVRIMGGIHPTYCPDEALDHCDYVIRGEGEISLPKLLIELQKDNPKLDSIAGLSYKKLEVQPIHNNLPQPISDKKILQMPPAWDLDPTLKKITGTPIFTPIRGCPFSCNFCSQPFGKKIRMADPEWVVDEIERVLKIESNSLILKLGKTLFIGSDNFTVDKKWAKEVFSLALKRNLAGKIKLQIQCRTDIADDPELLEYIKMFVNRVYIGIESFDNETLKKMNKRISAQKMKEQLNKIIGYQIPVHAHFIFGTDYDTSESVDRTVQDAKRIGIYSVSLYCAAPFPGTEYHYEMLKQNRIITSDWSRYNLHYIIIAPLFDKPSRFQEAIVKGYKDFYTGIRIRDVYKEHGWKAGIYELLLYSGFRAEDPHLKSHIDFLKEWEKNKYDNDNKFVCCSSESRRVTLAGTQVPARNGLKNLSLGREGYTS